MKVWSLCWRAENMRFRFFFRTYVDCVWDDFKRFWAFPRTSANVRERPRTSANIVFEKIISFVIFERILSDFDDFEPKTLIVVRNDWFRSIFADLHPFSLKSVELQRIQTNKSNSELMWSAIVISVLTFDNLSRPSTDDSLNGEVARIWIDYYWIWPTAYQGKQ